MIVIKPHGSDGRMSEGTPHYNQIVRESPFELRQLKTNPVWKRGSANQTERSSVSRI
jgi:hypothetical protein